MIDYPALKIEIAKPAYVGMTDTVIASTINALDAPTLKMFSPMDAMIVLMKNNDWGWLAGVADGWVTSSNASGAGAVAVSSVSPWLTRRLARTVKDLFSVSIQVDMSFQTNVDALSSALNALVTANVVTSASRTAIAALSALSRPGWALFGDRSLDFNDIVIARTF